MCFLFNRRLTIVLFKVSLLPYPSTKWYKYIYCKVLLIRSLIIRTSDWSPKKGFENWKVKFVYWVYALLVCRQQKLFLLEEVMCVLVYLWRKQKAQSSVGKGQPPIIKSFVLQWSKDLIHSQAPHITPYLTEGFLQEPAITKRQGISWQTVSTSSRLILFFFSVSHKMSAKVLVDSSALLIDLRLECNFFMSRSVCSVKMNTKLNQWQWNKNYKLCFKLTQVTIIGNYDQNGKFECVLPTKT